MVSYNTMKIDLWASHPLYREPLEGVDKKVQILYPFLTWLIQKEPHKIYIYIFNVYINMKVSAPGCPHPKCGSRMVRLYARVDGEGRYQFVPVGWWCRECGMTRM